jgi:hypothetical protein
VALKNEAKNPGPKRVEESFEFCSYVTSENCRKMVEIRLVFAPDELSWHGIQIEEAQLSYELSDALSTNFSSHLRVFLVAFPEIITATNYHSARHEIAGGLRRNLVMPDANGHLNREHVRDPKFYNERYRDKSIAESLDIYSQLQTPSHGFTDVTFADLLP